jgi:hypothetical protein
MALNLDYRYFGLSNEEIGRRFSRMHFSGNKAARRFNRKMQKDKDLLERVDDLESIVKA